MSEAIFQPSPEALRQALNALLFHAPLNRDLRTYAVLDGAAIPELLDHLYADPRPEFVCLYRGELEPDMAECAPYLVELMPDTPFTNWLLAEGWGKHWGIFALAPVDMKTLRKHFRTFLMVTDPEGNQVYFRYYDPRMFRIYLPTCNEREVLTVFGPVVNYLFEDEDPVSALRFSPEGAPPRKEVMALVPTIRKAQKTESPQAAKSHVIQPPVAGSQAASELPKATPSGDPSTATGKLLPLLIRQGQQQVFQQSAFKKFEEEMVVHSQEFSPRLCKVIGEHQLRVALRQAMKKASEYGFTFRGPIRLYIEMIFLFGSAFDTDPQYPWAGQILRAPEDQMERAERLYEMILDYQEKVSGPDSTFFRMALGKFHQMAQKPFEVSNSDFAATLHSRLTDAFPQKAAYIGQSGLMTLIRSGSLVSGKYQFPIRGEVLIVTLMFAFGHGCTVDPLYPWIERALQNHGNLGPVACAERLEKKSTTWLEHVHAQSPGGDRS